MLTIKEIFDICEEHGVFVDISHYNNRYADMYHYMIKLYYGKKRQYRMLNQMDLEYIFADRESFGEYINRFLDEVKEKEEKNDI